MAYIHKDQLRFCRGRVEFHKAELEMLVGQEHTEHYKNHAEYLEHYRERLRVELARVLELLN